MQTNMSEIRRPRQPVIHSLTLCFFLFSTSRYMWPQVLRTVWSHLELLTHSVPPIQNPLLFLLLFLYSTASPLRRRAGIRPLTPKLMRRRGECNGLLKSTGCSSVNPRVTQERKLAVEGARVGNGMSYITREQRGAVGFSFIYRQRWTTELCVTWLLAAGAIKSPTERDV